MSAREPSPSHGGMLRQLATLEATSPRLGPEEQRRCLPLLLVIIYLIIAIHATMIIQGICADRNVR